MRCSPRSPHRRSAARARRRVRLRKTLKASLSHRAKACRAALLRDLDTCPSRQPSRHARNVRARRPPHAHRQCSRSPSRGRAACAARGRSRTRSKAAAPRAPPCGRRRRRRHRRPGHRGLRRTAPRFSALPAPRVLNALRTRRVYHRCRQRRRYEGARRAAHLQVALVDEDRVGELDRAARRAQLRGETAQRRHAIAGTQMPRGDRGPETLADLQIDRQLLPPIDFDGQCGSRYGHEGLAGKGSGNRHGLVGSTILGTFR
jgi:hypothetical protein